MVKTNGSIQTWHRVVTFVRKRTAWSNQSCKRRKNVKLYRTQELTVRVTKKTEIRFTEIKIEVFVQVDFTHVYGI